MKIPENPFEETKKEIASALSRVEKFRKPCEDATRICSDLGIEYGSKESGVTHLSIGWHTGTVPGVLIAFRAATFDDVRPLLARLRLAGYRPKGEPEDYEELKRRTYNFDPIRVMVFFDIEKEGPSCKFEKVGQKTVDVFRLICDDEDPNLIGEGAGA